MSPGAGTRIGPFSITGRLGAGGMATVYRAEGPGGPVALKVASAAAARDPELRARFEREAAAMSAVASPFVAAARGTGVHEGVPWIALELLEGGTLQDRLKSAGRLPWEEAVRRGAEIARGLAALHARGLVHRDVKPENVLLDDTGRAKLSDLGLVGFAGSTPAGATPGLTATGEILGTPAFMAPEQANGEPVEPAVDLYGLGATLHALVAGEPPFGGQGLSLLKKVLGEPPPPLRTLAPRTPPELEALVQRLLAKEPSRRGASALALAGELDELARRSPGRSFSPVAAGVLGALAVVAALAALLAARTPGRDPGPTGSSTASTGTSARTTAPVASDDPLDLPGFATFRRSESGRARLTDVWGDDGAGREVLSVQFDPRGDFVAAGRADGFVALWAPGRSAPIASLTSKAACRRVVPLGRRRLFIAWEDGMTPLALWDGASAEAETLAGPHYVPMAVVAPRDHPEYLLVVSARTTYSSTIVRWKVAEAPVFDAVYTAARTPSSAFACTGAGSLFVLGGESFATCEARPNAETIVVDARPVSAVAIEPLGVEAMAGEPDGTVSFREIIHGKERACVRAHTGPVDAVAIAPDGKTALSAAQDGRIVFWDYRKRETVDAISLAAAGDAPRSLAFAPDGASFVVGTRRGLVLRYALAVTSPRPAPR